MGKTSRRNFLRGTATAAIGLAGQSCTKKSQSERTGKEGRRPNIILILADDMGFSDIGCYGGEVLTPNLDRMATGGLRFSRFYNVARCCPTRASLLTGLHPHQTGVGHMTWGLGPEHPGYRGDLNKNCVTIAEVLRPAGYRTACVGKWHVCPGDAKYNWPNQRGFEKYYGGSDTFFFPNIQIDNTHTKIEDPDYYITDAFGDKTVEFMDDFRKEGDDPFFIHVAYSAPHWPLQAWPEDIKKYREVYRKGWDQIRRERYHRMTDSGLVDVRWPLTPRDRDARPWSETPHKPWEVERMAAYAAQIDRMDQSIGRIWQKVKEMGEEENTLFLFLSDNGGSAEVVLPVFANFRIFAKETPDGRKVRYGNVPSVMPGPADTFQSYGLAWANASNTPYRLYKHWIHEGGIATPLIAYWPGGIQGGSAISHQLAHIIDVMATCVDLAGAEYPGSHKGHDITPMEGKSLAPVFEGQVREGHATLCWEHEGHRAARHENMKLVSKYPESWELYDLESDRTELYDLSARYPDKVRELSSLYQEWAKKCQVEPWETLAPLVDESFRDFMNLPEDFQLGASDG